MIKLNVSEAHRAIDQGVAKVNRVIAKTIADELWKEFERLVNETPQYTGTAAASWNMAAEHPGGGVRVQNPGISREQVIANQLSAGHGAATSVAFAANRGNLKAFSDGKFIYRDLFVWNDAPSVSYAEEGPLRKANYDHPGRGPGAAARFQERVARITATIHEDIKI